MTAEASPPKPDERLIALIDGIRRHFGPCRIRIKIPGASGTLVIPAHPDYRAPSPPKEIQHGS